MTEEKKYNLEEFFNIFEYNRSMFERLGKMHDAFWDFYLCFQIAIGKEEANEIFDKMWEAYKKLFCKMVENRIENVKKQLKGS